MPDDDCGFIYRRRTLTSQVNAALVPQKPVSAEAFGRQSTAKKTKEGYIVFDNSKHPIYQILESEIEKRTMRRPYRRNIRFCIAVLEEFGYQIVNIATAFSFLPEDTLPKSFRVPYRKNLKFLGDNIYHKISTNTQVPQAVVMALSFYVEKFAPSDVSTSTWLSEDELNVLKGLNSLIQKSANEKPVRAVRKGQKEVCAP